MAQTDTNRAFDDFRGIESRYRFAAYEVASGELLFAGAFAHQIAEQAAAELGGDASKVEVIDCGRFGFKVIDGDAMKNPMSLTAAKNFIASVRT